MILNNMTDLTTLEGMKYALKYGDVQLAYNTNLNIQVLMLGDGVDYIVHIIRGNKILMSADVSFENEVGYYTAHEIAQQSNSLPKSLLLHKNNPLSLNPLIP